LVGQPDPPRTVDRDHQPGLVRHQRAARGVEDLPAHRGHDDGPGAGLGRPVDELGPAYDLHLPEPHGERRDHHQHQHLHHEQPGPHAVHSAYLSRVPLETSQTTTGATTSVHTTVTGTCWVSVAAVTRGSDSSPLTAAASSGASSTHTTTVTARPPTPRPAR